jgi:hypothetical protein
VSRHELDAAALALIGLFARAYWTHTARAIATGTIDPPEHAAGGITRAWKDQPAAPEYEILGGEESWVATRDGIKTGLNTTVSPPPVHQVRWPAVRRWLYGFSPTERARAQQLLDAFHELHRHRPDEQYHPALDRAEAEAARDRYDARMNSGDRAAIAQHRNAFHSLVGTHLVPDPVLI